MMDNDKTQKSREGKAADGQAPEGARSQVTIMFTDIKGSTSYFERKGDHEGMAMINRHNSILFPIIEQCGGRVVKTIGDAIMALFRDPVGSVKAAAEMQRALDEDRKGRREGERIHIRIGIHTGLGLEKDNDVFGDVVNAAAGTQRQCEPDQILVTGVLLDAVKATGLQSVKMGRAELKGKDELIDVYAVAWSESAAEQLIEEVRALYERKLKEARQQYEQLEEEFETGREQWRLERRNLTAEMEQLEESVDRVREGALQQVSEDLHSELRFQLEEALSARRQAEEDLSAATDRWEGERNNLKSHIHSMEASVVEAMERSNNPTRTAMAVREQLEAKIAEAKEDWQLQWDGERKRLAAEIERLRKSGGGAGERDAARRAVLEKLRKLPSAAGGAKTANQWQEEYQAARLQWDAERDQLNLNLRKLERELQNSKDSLRSEIFQELRAQYEPKLVEASREGRRLQQEMDSINAQLTEERQRLTARVRQLEQAVPEAKAAVRKQVLAEQTVQFDLRIEEANRLKSRLERQHQESAEEWDAERRRMKKQIAELQELLKEAKGAAFRAQRASGSTTTDS
jgi:class 3 adenylate cyclase